MGRVFVSAPLPGDAIDLLRAHHDVEVGAPLGDGDAWVTLLTDHVDAARLESAPRLRIVANVAVGIDNVDLTACNARGVFVSNTPGVLTEATADLAFGLLLAAMRRIAEGDRLVRSHGWTGWSPTLLVGKRVCGATLGIVGMGRIGQAVARRARGFDMPVLYAQRAPLSPALELALGATYATLDDLLARSDVVSLHCPLTDETRGLLSSERLARMKPGSVLVNTARGAVVDEAALARALEKGNHSFRDDCSSCRTSFLRRTLRAPRARHAKRWPGWPPTMCSQCCGETSRPIASSLEHQSPRPSPASLGSTAGLCAGGSPYSRRILEASASRITCSW
jgi:glyoxylate reductase